MRLASSPQNLNALLVNRVLAHDVLVDVACARMMMLSMSLPRMQVLKSPIMRDLIVVRGVCSTQLEVSTLLAAVQHDVVIVIGVENLSVPQELQVKMLLAKLIVVLSQLR